MSITNISDLDFSKKYTYSDYLLWKFSERVELIKGFINKMSPAPSSSHQKVSANIGGIFYVNFKNTPCQYFTAPFDVVLNIPNVNYKDTVVQPDLCVICDASKIDKDGCKGSPELIVEIISKKNSKYDMQTKFNLYQEAGVKEYWIIDPLDKLLLVYTLVNDKYIGLQPQTDGENIKSRLFPDLNISLDDVFERV